MNNKADDTNTYVKTDVYVLLSILQAGKIIVFWVIQLIWIVNVKQMQLPTILKVQTVDGSTLYDSLELSFNTIDQTSILNITNIDILASLASTIPSSNVYTKREINDNDVIYDNALTNKADRTNT